MNWRVKAAVQKALAALPGGAGDRLNRDLPALLGRRRSQDLGKRALGILNGHAEPILSLGLPAGSASVLELGTGYNFFGAIPLALLGYPVTTVDLTRDVTLEAARGLLAALRPHLAGLAAHPASRLSEADVSAKYEAMMRAESLDALLSRSGIAYRAPYSPGSFAREHQGAFGYAFSHCVFEHLKPDGIESVLAMLRQVSSPQALFSHQVDVRDHRSSEGMWMDPRLSYLDFLTLPAETWRFWNDNAIAYTNRWRKSDYVRALQSHGFEVAGGRDLLWPGAALPLPISELHPDFQHYTEADLRVMSFLVYGRVVH